MVYAIFGYTDESLSYCLSVHPGHPRTAMLEV